MPPIDEQLARIFEKLEILDEAIRGDARGRSVGLLNRVDRLEQTESRRSKAVWIAVGSGITSIVSFLGSLVWRCV